MNVIAKLSLLSAICGLVACKPESQLDLTSLAAQSNGHTAAMNGYVITKQNNLLAIPDDYIQIHKLSGQLLNRHWLQNPDFLYELEELLALFKKTRLPEANVFITSLEETKQRYLTSLDNADLIARTVQRELDEDLNCYNRSIKDLQQKIRFLQASEESYSQKINTITEQIKKQSRQYAQLNAELHQSLHSLMAKHDPDIKLINEIKFDYINLPHSICSQYKGMSELLKTVPHNCVYINRDQLLSPFPSNLKETATELIDGYAAQLWNTMTQLSGFFDTTENKQYFPDNLNNQLTLVRTALREKNYLSDHESASLIESYKKQLKKIEKKRDDKINTEYLNQHLQIDTSSVAFINHFCTAEPPTRPFDKVYHSTNSRLHFTKAYAEKMLREYPADLHFAVSEDGFFTIPKRKQANRVIIELSSEEQFIAYKISKCSEFPFIIKPHSKNATIVSHSLIAEMNARLRRYWSS